MNFKHLYLSTDGRINRGKFWGGMLLLYLVAGIVVALDLLVLEVGFVAIVAYLACLFPIIALNIKRCHDRNRTGWFFLLALVPVVSLWYLVECGFLRGTVGPNQYGPDPLGASEGLVVGATAG